MSTRQTDKTADAAKARTQYTSTQYTIRVPAHIENALNAARIEHGREFPPTRNQFLMAVIEKGLQHYYPAAKNAA